MVITTKRVYNGNKPTNEILVSFRNGSSIKTLNTSHTVAVLDALDETEAVTVALNDPGVLEFLELA